MNEPSTRMLYAMFGVGLIIILAIALSTRAPDGLRSFAGSFQPETAADYLLEIPRRFAPQRVASPTPTP